jgi:hypothetical protein
MPIIMPITAIATIIGTYLKISFFTPVREVKVVDPVKFSPRYATTAGMIRSGTSAPAPVARLGIPEDNAYI